MNFYDLASKNFIQGRTRTRLELWEEHLKVQWQRADRVFVSQNPFTCVPFVLDGGQRGREKILHKVWKDPTCKGSGHFCIPRALWVCARQPASEMFRGSTGRMASSSSSSLRRSLSFFPLLLRRHCLHLMVEETPLCQVVACLLN